MRDRPSGLLLLRQARKTLLDSLLPAVPAEKRYEALMVANALAIATRELEADEAALADRTDLDQVRARTALAAEIRVGARDGDPATLADLRRDVAARLRLSNPKALPEDGPD